MSDSWIEKTEDEIKNEIISWAKEETGLTNFKSVGVLRGFLEVLALTAIKAYTGYINPIYKQANLDSATGLWLSLWGLLVGVTRKKAIKAVGSLAGVAYDDGKLQKGTWIVTDGTALRFKVTNDVSFYAGVFSIPVEAEFAGSAYNLVPGTSIRATRVVQGLDSVSVPASWISTLGTDDELDDAYRARIKDKWKSIGEGNPTSKYEYIAASVDGVVSAKVIRTPRGYGSTDVLITSVEGLPSAELLQAVRAALDSYGLVCRDLLVRAPGAVTCNVHIEYKGSATAEVVGLAARKYILSLGIGGKLEVRKFYTEPWSTFAFDSLEILAPTRDVVAGANELIVPGTVTVTKVG